MDKKECCCRVNLVEEDAESGNASSGGVDVVVPVLGRFNSVVERRSCGTCLRQLAGTLPWSILLVAAVQVAVEYCCERDTALALSLRGGATEDQHQSLGDLAEFAASTMEDSLKSYLRFFSYMFAHKDRSHLWSNFATQLTLAWFASASASRRSAGIGAQLELLLVYLFSGFCGGLAFRAALAADPGSPWSGAGLVGGSAGVFGLAGVCLFDSLADAAQILSRWTRSRKMKGDSYSNLGGTCRQRLKVATSRGLLLLASRTLAAAVIVGFDLYHLAAGTEEDNSDVIAVHLGGLAGGLAASAALEGAKQAWRWGRRANKGGGTASSVSGGGGGVPSALLRSASVVEAVRTLPLLPGRAKRASPDEASFVADM